MALAFDISVRLENPEIPILMNAIFRVLCFPIGCIACCLSGVLAADIDVSKVEPMTMSHSLDWVRQKVSGEQKQYWDSVLDEINWGTPSGKSVVRNWDFRLSDEAWAELVEQNGAAPDQDVTFDLWIPEDAHPVQGVVAMSGHGSGTKLFLNTELREIARELHLALFRFTGNPMQRGFWPRSLLYDTLGEMGAEVGHPELENAPLFLYGHSNGTGFSALFTASESDRVWAWVSMRPGTTYQTFQPEAASVPGLVIFGEDDQFFARPSIEENLAVLGLMRSKYNAVWHYAVEPHTGHGPTENTWPLVFDFLKQTYAARVPDGVDTTKGPVELLALDADSGYRGQGWDPETGGYQNLEISPVESFQGDAASASWLLNEDYAENWQTFQRDGKIE